MSNSMTPEEYKINHLKQRIAEITVEYEERLANGSIQLQMLVQERDDLAQRLASHESDSKDAEVIDI